MSYGDSFIKMRHLYRLIIKPKQINKKAVHQLWLHFQAFIRTCLKGLEAKQQIIDALIKENHELRKDARRVIGGAE
jgi:hypothetical protein